MSVVAGGHQGRAGQDVGQLAQMQERGLGLLVAGLLGVALAGRYLPLQPPQGVGRGGGLGPRPTAQVLADATAADAQRPGVERSPAGPLLPAHVL
jgi:hypothetical protein